MTHYESTVTFYVTINSYVVPNDVWFFLKNNWPINEKIIEKRTNLSMKQFLKKCINLLEGISDRGILSGVGELLDAKQKMWVKEN